MPLGQRTDLGNSVYSGVLTPFCCDIEETLKDALSQGFDFLAAPLFHPRFRRPSSGYLGSLNLAQTRLTRSDLLLSTQNWSAQVVGLLSPWINPDSENEALRRDSCLALQREIEWAIHLGLQAVIFTIRPNTHCFANTASVLLKILSGSVGNISIWIRIPLMKFLTNSKSPILEKPNVINTNSTKLSSEKNIKNLILNRDPWEHWHQIQALCNYHSSICLVLELCQNLLDKRDVERYVGEPLKAIIIPTSVYKTNNKGYPVLETLHQEVIEMFIQQEAQLITTGPKLHKLPKTLNSKNKGDAIENENPVGDLKLYLEYISFLFRRIAPLDETEVKEFNYRDHLQIPLEPLHDNLEAQTYEVFEKDTAKYEGYYEAIYQAFCDRQLEGDQPLVAMVVGAGRGPLVAAVLEASKKSGKPVRVYAIEKNPNAIITLNNRISDDRWEDSVTVVSCDMRNWEPPEKCDFLISELLGSFADNELSPECLDGAQRLLKKDGISIPSSYTSYLAPATATKAHNKARTLAQDNREKCSLEMPYVIKLHNFSLISEPQPIFHFSHPNQSQALVDNSRYCSIEFGDLAISSGCLLHGFVGYFETILYKHVCLSTVPKRHTPSMSSWFPIFFPLKNPIFLKQAKSRIISLHIWRRISLQKVWYEWCVTSPEVTQVHNSSGKSYSISLQ